MFCSQCGKQLLDNAKFCSYCGAPVLKSTQPVATHTDPTPINKENVIWVFKADRKFGLFKVVPCHVVFMEDKLVLAYMTAELQKAESAKASAEIKEDKLGFFKGSAAMIKYWANYHKRYYDMSVDDILAQEPSNAIIPYSQITEVLFNGNEDFNDDTVNTNSGKLHFELTNGETLKFTHSQAANRSIKDTLSRLFGRRLKYKI